MDFKEISERYDLEIDRIVAEIKKEKPKTVLLQFPEGLKQYATEIVDILESKTKAEFFIWMGTCFGACDIPKTDADLIIQFGHAPWGKKEFNEL